MSTFIKEFDYMQLAFRIPFPEKTQIILLTGASDQFRKFFSVKLAADRRKTRGY
jgi:hypothetical protein